MLWLDAKLSPNVPLPVTSDTVTVIRAPLVVLTALMTPLAVPVVSRVKSSKLTFCTASSNVTSNVSVSALVTASVVRILASAEGAVVSIR